MRSYIDVSSFHRIGIGEALVHFTIWDHLNIRNVDLDVFNSFVFELRFIFVYSEIRKPVTSATDAGMPPTG